MRSDIRRLSFVLIAQRLGLSLSAIADELTQLPSRRTPNRSDWQAISGRLHAALDAQIAGLDCTRANLDGCIGCGCGCLSLDACALFNTGDRRRALARGRALRWRGRMRKLVALKFPRFVIPAKAGIHHRRWRSYAGLGDGASRSRGVTMELEQGGMKRSNLSA